MENTVGCKNYLDENSPGYVVEYRGNFKDEIDKVDYACGDKRNICITRYSSSKCR
ncbi:hypothetical protein SDC9_48900 [bioreactor metagenome]|uniref:Uncharacterized protein n=2 Tax=root TaxID=1 RepID=R9CAS0_9CLOT|nr:hypothetical protein [Clostridium sartagoforme]EOR26469.1 hypothetical protein A500_07836 [Clostridium sartagoforme AAU1]